MASAWPFVLAIAVLALLAAQPAFAHLDMTRYNGNDRYTERYFVYQTLNPEYAAPGEPVAISFSIQDRGGKDVSSVETMVEVYASDGQRLKAFPWTMQDTGDFSTYYSFPTQGTYQIVLSIADGPVSSATIDPPRSLLAGTAGCNCERVVLNVNVSKTFGSIFTGTILGAVLVPTAGLGVVMWSNYKNKKSRMRGTNELIKYAVMLSAVAGGMVHFAVYSEHGSLRLEYPIFLIWAGGMQISYGMFYILLTLSSESKAMSPAQYYRKSLTLNLFGLAGTAVLLGLYTYSVIFPPPLSPTNQPEAVSLAGVLAKSVEVFLVGGILYLMRVEKNRLRAISSKT